MAPTLCYRFQLWFLAKSQCSLVARMAPTETVSNHEETAYVAVLSRSTHGSYSLIKDFKELNDVAVLSRSTHGSYNLIIIKRLLWSCRSALS
jgi:hypothetical protein